MCTSKVLSPNLDGSRPVIQKKQNTCAWYLQPWFAQECGARDSSGTEQVSVALYPGDSNGFRQFLV